MDAESSIDTYSLKLEGQGVAIDRRVSEITALQILQLVLGGVVAGAAARATEGSDTTPLTARPAISIREFLEEVGASRNPEKILVFCEYATTFERLPDVSRDDIRSRFRPAGESLPANFPRDFAMAIQSGWLAEDPSIPGRFYVTKKGKEVIEQKFKGIPRKGRSSRGGGNRRADSRSLEDYASNTQS